MNSIDFLCQELNMKKPAFIGLLCCFALPVGAEPPSVDEFIQRSKLVLTLSDKWDEPNKATQNLLLKTNHNNHQQLIIKTSKTKPANIGCGMDVNHIPTTATDTSLTSRVVGKCNFNYQY